MTIKFTQDEKETIINLDKAEPMVNVSTCNRQWQRRMVETGIQPIRTEEQARAYEFPEKWIRLSAKPPQLLGIHA